MRSHLIKLVVGAACVALVVATPVPAWADPGSGPLPQADNPLAVSRANIAGFGGYVSGVGDGLESGPTFGASVAFYFTRNLGVEAGFQRQSLDLTRTSSNQLSGGTLDSTVATVGIAVRFPAGDRVAPYVVGGIAYFANSYEIDPAIAAPLAEFNFAPTESLASVLGFQVGGGVDIALARRVAVFGEARYLAGTADTVAGLRDTVSGISAESAGEQDLARFQATAGVRIIF